MPSKNPRVISGGFFGWHVKGSIKFGPISLYFISSRAKTTTLKGRGSIDKTSKVGGPNVDFCLKLNVSPITK